MNNLRVSIVMATWNRAALIGVAIESVRKQTFKDWELLIIDDGSPDNTAEVVAEWHRKDSRIVYLKIPRVGNVAKVSNAGLHAARGKYVAILDDDDWWHDPRKLEKQVAFMDAHPEYVGCGSGFLIVNGEGKEIDRRLKPERDEDIRRMVLCANPIANSSTLFRSNTGEEYDGSLLQFADWDFWLRLLQKGKFYNFPEYFLAYRMWNQNSSLMKLNENADMTQIIIRRYRNEYPGFVKAATIATLLGWYAHVPVVIRRRTDQLLSRLKKTIFSR